MQIDFADLPLLQRYYGSTIEGQIEEVLAPIFAPIAVNILAPFMTMVGKYGLPLGRYSLINNQIYASCEKTGGRGFQNSPLESHKKYYDIQIVLEGQDKIGIAPISEMKEKAFKYNFEKDYITYADQPTSHITLTPGFFIIFPPHICHAPLSGHGELRKLVIKVETLYAL
ncbi:MAG: YhcH/YjgK/YiaL family protein [Chlamydia sp.]